MSTGLFRDLVDRFRDVRPAVAGRRVVALGGRVSFAVPTSAAPSRGERDPEEVFLFWAFRPYF